MFSRSPARWGADLQAVLTWRTAAMAVVSVAGLVEVRSGALSYLHAVAVVVAIHGQDH